MIQFRNGCITLLFVIAASLAGAPKMPPPQPGDRPAPPPPAQQPPTSRSIPTGGDQLGPAKQSDEQQAAAMRNAVPGPRHEMLAKLAGTWTCTSTMTLEPGAPPIESAGESVNEMVMGGRFLHERWTGTMMGQPVTSARFTGFNNGTRLFESNWTYTMSTGMLVAVGELQADGTTVLFRGSFNEGAAGGGISVLYITLRLVSEDEYVYEVRDAAPGEPQRGPVMVTTYRRKR